jgi:hypothetical protein
MVVDVQLGRVYYTNDEVRRFLIINHPLLMALGNFAASPLPRPTTPTLHCPLSTPRAALIIINLNDPFWRQGISQWEIPTTKPTTLAKVRTPQTPPLFQAAPFYTRF